MPMEVFRRVCFFIIITGLFFKSYSQFTRIIVPVDSTYKIDSTYLHEIKSTIIVGIPIDNRSGFFRKIDLRATGFFVYDDVLGTQACYLVSNLHAFEKLSGKYYFNQIALPYKMRCLYPKSKKYATFYLSWFPIPLLSINDHEVEMFEATGYVPANVMYSHHLKPNWKTFTKGFVDLGIIKVDSSQYFENDSIFASEHTPIKISSELSYDKLFVGDSVYTFGYPENFYKITEIDSFTKKRQNFPTEYLPKFKMGIILQKDSLINIKSYGGVPKKLRDIFITNISSVPGQSGSPVFIRRNNKFYLIGINAAGKSNISIVWSADWIIKILRENINYFNKLKAIRKF